MNEFTGFGAIRTAVAQIVGNLGVFLRIALGWTFLVAAFLVGYCVVKWGMGLGPLDIAGGLNSLGEPENFRLQNGLTLIPNTLASLSVAIQWTRFVVRGERPTGWLTVPIGSGRYLGRSIGVALGCVLTLVPGLFVASMVASKVPSPLAVVAPVTVIAVNGIISIYLAVRLWLVFPAIALGNKAVGFAKSFRLTRPFAGRLLGTTIAVYAIFLLGGVLVEVIYELAALRGVAADILAVADEILTDLFVFAATAAAAGVCALAYRSAVAAQ
jgi:hypothetical protein